MYKEIEGNLISLALAGEFEVIAHGCNCFCTQKKGIAKDMARIFDTTNPDKYSLEEAVFHKGNYNKMGQIESWIYEPLTLSLNVVNCYTQYGMGNPKGDLDYEALTLCIRKLASKFRGKKIGLPQIGCGLAKGDWTRVKSIIETELAAYCDVTVVIFNK